MEKTLLFLTVACCVLHLLHCLPLEIPNIPGNYLTFFCGFFPAVGAALAGISNQGEFRRIAQRSKSMSERLGGQLKRVEHLENQLSKNGWDKKQLSIATKEVSGNIARTMVSEVLDWRVIFQDRPLKTG